jgi:glycosyltransferase involved in cell wall biosynthesis
MLPNTLVIAGSIYQIARILNYSNKMTHPLVSILMPVYNAEKYLREAAESILSQTFSDFEFIALNDGSSDDSGAILFEYEKKDARVVFRNFEENRGLPALLNIGMSMARGRYLARMDADDVSFPTRLQEQVDFMESHPEVDICGTWVELIGARQGERWQHPVDHASIYARMLFNDALAHPTVMMRVSSIRKHNLLYDEKSMYIEDYDLWSRALPKLQVSNLGQVLLKYRVHAQGISVKYRVEQIQAHDVVYRRLLESIQVYPSLRELQIHQKISNFQYEANLSFLYDSYLWLKKISRANRKAQIIPIVVLSAELKMWWLRVSSYVFFHPPENPRLFLGRFRFPLGRIKKLAYKLTSLVRFDAN